jgi:hypothetical protein
MNNIHKALIAKANNNNDIFKTLRIYNPNNYIQRNIFLRKNWKTTSGGEKQILESLKSDKA